MFSVEDETIQLDEYNIFVGPNAAGKTNFIRLLRLISDRMQMGGLENPFRDLFLNNKNRLTSEKTSTVMLGLALSDAELTMIVTFLLQKYTTKFNGNALRNVTLIIQWLPGPDLAQSPSIILLHFENGFSLLYNRGRELILLSNKISSILIEGETNSTVELEKLLSQFGRVPDIKFEEQHYSIPKNIRMPSNFLAFDEFKIPFLEGKIISEFEYMYEKYYIEFTNVSTKYSPDWRAPIFDYCGILTNRRNSIISFWTVIHSIIHNNLIFLKELRPSPSELANELLRIEKTPELTQQYDLIKSNFENIFPDVSFKVLLSDKGELQYFVQIQEKSNRKFALEDSASGYYEALCIFKMVSANSDGILLMDEPALHLHPLKIKFLSRILQHSNRQIIILTHSPYFVETQLFKSGRNLIYVQRSDGKSNYSHRGSNFQFRIISSLFRPDVFFSKFVILVEGASDVATVSAISDALGNVLEKNDIIVVGCDGNRNVGKYHLLLKEFHIPHIAIVDSPYPNQIDSQVIILNGELEDELSTIGWSGAKNSINSNEAYEFISRLMQDEEGRDKIRKSVFGRLITSVLESVGVANVFGTLGT